GNPAPPDACRFEREGYGVRRIVRHREGMNFHVPDGERLARRERFEGGDARVPPDRGAGSGRDVDGDFRPQRKRAQAADVVLMLVGDENSVTAIETLLCHTQASRGRFPAKARVHQQARLLRANPGGVTSTAAAQHANPYAQETLPALGPSSMVALSLR